MQSLTFSSANEEVFGHPKGITTLFFTELWERFSYYGMRALLVLYMVAPLAQGGLGFSTRVAATIYGVYTMSVYMSSIPGGLLADRLFGLRKAIFIGGVVIALGHFCMAFSSIVMFALGLALIVIGTGLLKPNISALLGSLYKEGDERRDAGFSIFYMGINIGAALAPLVCGYLAQSDSFKHLIERYGLKPESSWHFGFAAAGVGMLIGLVHFVWQRRWLGSAGDRAPTGSSTAEEQSASFRQPEQLFNAAEGKQRSLLALSQLSRIVTSVFRLGFATSAFRLFSDSLSVQEWRRIAAIAVLFLFNMWFWAVYEQGGSSLNLFADRMTRCEIFGLGFPSSWFQSLPAIFVVVLAPLFSALWIKLGRRQPSSPVKFAFGLTFLGLGIAIAVPATMLAVSGKVSPLWLAGVYFLQVVGEMCLSPVGLSTVTKLAPQRFVGVTMGVWFVSMALGNLLAGWLAGFFDDRNAQALITLFGAMALLSVLAALILWMLSPWVKKLMGTVK